MSIDSLSSRQQLLLTLCGDLNAQGWNQKHKYWFVKGEPTDEWLEFGGEFSGAPENHLLDLIMATALPTDAHGVLIASEGWEYPKRLVDSFKTEASRRSYWRTTPPSEHPERVEIRHLMLACDDGDVLALTMSNEPEPAIGWASIDASTPCPVGERTVDAARALLGLNEPLAERLMQYEGLKVLGNITEAIEKAMTGEVTEEEITRDIFLALPEPLRYQMIKEMPDDIKDIVRRVLTDEEQRKYGL